MNSFVEEIKIIHLRKLFFIENPIDLCKLKYPGHPNGCPNIVNNLKKGNKPKLSCPPFAKRLSEKYDLFNQDKYFCYVKFNLKKQKEKMKLLHPEWTDKKCGCLLYWQKSVVKELKKKCLSFILFAKNIFKAKEKYEYELIPEAMGLDVFETAAYYDVILERNPQNYVYKIAFIGVLKNGNV